MKKILTSVASLGLASVLLAFGGLTSAEAAQLANGPVVSVDTHAVGAPAKIAGAPQDVYGYTNHCRDRMAERGITEYDIQIVAQYYWPSAVYQPAGDTWKYFNPNSGVTAVLSSSGYCVTAWRN